MPGIGRYQVVTIRLLLIPASALLLAAPAGASIQVLWSTSARACYLAASALASPRQEDSEHCDRALSVERLSPRDLAATHVNRAIVRHRRGDLRAALADYDTALELEPSQPDAYLNRGLTLLRANRPAEALRDFDAAIANNPERPALAYYGRAGAYEDLGNLRAAYFDYRRASELAPEWTRPRRELARFTVR
jgi:tetratricopeptide (TPR) repeat protein